MRTFCRPPLPITTDALSEFIIGRNDSAKEVPIFFFSPPRPPRAGARDGAPDLIPAGICDFFTKITRIKHDNGSRPGSIGMAGNGRGLPPLSDILRRFEGRVNPA